MSDYGPSSDTLQDTSPLLRFTSAMRWPRDRREETITGDAEPLVDETALTGRLADIESRIGKLAERFDQLEFVIVEQFEPGMTDGGDLPSGNLRDRLDRIEAGLGQLRGPSDATRASWNEATAPDEEVLDAAMVEARLDEITARLTDLARRADEPVGAGVAETVDARLGALEARLDAVADEAAARHEALLAAVATEVAIRHEALRTAIGSDAAARSQSALAEATAEAQARAEAIGAKLATEAEKRHEAVLAALERAMSRPAPAPDLTQQHRSFAGFATALQTTLSQFETSVDSILDRLDGMAQRLEAVETRMAQPAVDDASATPVAATGLETSLGALSEGIAALVQVLGQRAADPRGGTDPAMLGQLGALVSAAVEEAARDNRAALDETLRDLRLALAEVAADNMRLRIA